VAHAGTTQAEVEPSVLPVGMGAEVGGEPTASANASVDIAAADKVGRWSHDVYHSVLRGSSSGRSCHSLALLVFLVGADHIIRDDDIANKLWKCFSSVDRHALL
jgi:hypothetical protein